MSASVNLDFAYANGPPTASADFRVHPQDFIVEEELGFSPTGSGEHALVEIIKTGHNTTWVAKQIANFAGVKVRDVGFCGRKDRHAQCRQWFSVYLPSDKHLNWQDLQQPGIHIQSHTRHSHKLRPGQHRGNRFQITLRAVSDAETLTARLETINAGVPNYFGEQRFGIDGHNLCEADRWANGDIRIGDKKQRGLMISALRSYLFNAVLSARVQAQNWRQILAGDVDETESTGPLWGRGRAPVDRATAQLEQTVLEPFGHWRHALEHCGLGQERRELVCRPADFFYDFQDNDLVIEFALSAGQYATSVLREVAQLHNRAKPRRQTKPVDPNYA